MRELPEPDIHPEEARDMGLEELPYFAAESVLAIQKQAYEDGLRDAKKVVSAEEILDVEDNADDAYNCGVLDCVRAIDKLTASQEKK